MTAVSGRLLGDVCYFDRLRRLTCLARGSLLISGVMALATTGCLVTDSPTYDKPKRTPPYLTNFDPPPYEIQTIAVRPGTNPDDRNYIPSYVAFDVVSEDLGDDVVAAVFLNFKGVNSPITQYLCKETLQPATLRTTGRRVKCDFTLTIEPSCATISAVVSHGFIEFSAKPIEDLDVDIATWTFQVGIDLTDPSWRPCIPDPKPTDGGTDAPMDRGAL